MAFFLAMSKENVNSKNSEARAEGGASPSGFKAPSSSPILSTLQKVLDLIDKHLGRLDEKHKDTDILMAREKLDTLIEFMKWKNTQRSSYYKSSYRPSYTRKYYGGRRTWRK